MGLNYYYLPTRATVARRVASILIIIFGSLQLAYGQAAQSFNNGRRTLPAAAVPTTLPTIDPAYSGSYTAIDLGLVPTSIAAETGALTFRDANTLLIDVNTFQPNAELDAVTVVRGADQHITGFAGIGTKVADAPYLDGGLQFGFNGVLFYTAFGPNQLVQFKPGSTAPPTIPSTSRRWGWALPWAVLALCLEDFPDRAVSSSSRGMRRRGTAHSSARTVRRHSSIHQPADSARPSLCELGGDGFHQGRSAAVFGE